MRQNRRTHGQHAVPITFGFAVALYVSRLGQRLEAIAQAAANLRGKFAGAVGPTTPCRCSGTATPQPSRRRRCGALGLKPPEISSQVAQPEYVADYVYALTSCWGVMANLADDFRHLLQRDPRDLRP